MLASDLNVFFDSKQKSVANLLKLKEEYDLCDSWRKRNPFKKSYILRPNQSSGMDHRLDHIFILNKLQEFSETDIIPAFKINHSVLLFQIIIF